MFTIEEDFLDRRFGIKYIGYPTVGLVILAVVMWPVSVRHALSIAMMALGYVSVGIGFLLTVLYYRRFRTHA